MRNLKKSINKLGWKHNLENSNWVECDETSEELKDLVNKVGELETKFFYAIDIISNNNNLQILEINICPGIEKAQTTFGVTPSSRS